jgi:hypothetical protein
MMPKYTIEYAVNFKRHPETYHYNGDDPVATGEFLEELLERGYHIKAIRHEGLDLPRPEFDKMIKTAAGMLAAKSIRSSLGISTEEEHYRFGFAS